MTILHFFPFFSLDTKGGTEIFIKSLARYQYDRGHNVQIIGPNITEEVNIEYFEGIKVTYFPFPYGTKNQNFISGRITHQTNYKFAEIVDKIHPDIVHIHGYHTAYHKYFVALKRDYTLLFTPHLIHSICPKGNLINNRNEICDGRVEMQRCAECLNFSSYQKISKGILKRKIKLELVLLNHFNIFYKFKMFSIEKNIISKLNSIMYFRKKIKFDALSPWFSEILSINGIPSQNIYQFSNPIFEIKNYSVDIVNGSNTSYFKFLYVGRISIEKGCLMMLEVIQSLAEFKNCFLIDMIGKIGCKNIRDKIYELKRLGFEINLLGEFENDQLEYQYTTHDYLLFPSSKFAGEMFPLVIQEAIENDLPIISSDIPGCEQAIKHNVNGFLFRADDKEDLRKILVEVISKKRKIEFLFDKGIDIKNKRNQYYEDLYFDLIQNKKCFT